MATASERELILAACIGGRPNHAGFVRVNCPVCPARIGKDDRDVSLGYRPKTGGFRCFKCGVNGRMQGEGYVLPEQAAADAPDVPAVVIPRDDFFPIWTDSNWNSETIAPARAYLERRGFSRENLTMADAHAAITGKYQGRVVIPHKDGAERWWGFTSRIYAPSLAQTDAPKVLYPKNMDRSRMYNDQVLHDASSVPVMVVEGCLDAAWYLPLCVAALGKPTAAHLDLLCSASRPVVFCLDGDAWETARALMMRMRLRGRKASYVRLPPGEDPNSVDPAWLRGEVTNAAAALKEDDQCKPSNPSP